MKIAIITSKETIFAPAHGYGVLYRRVGKDHDDEQIIRVCLYRSC